MATVEITREDTGWAVTVWDTAARRLSIRRWPDWETAAIYAAATRDER